jgi:hypothetical protein
MLAARCGSMNVVKMVHTFNTAATPRTCKRKVFPAAPGRMTTHARVVKVSWSCIL